MKVVAKISRLILGLVFIVSAVLKFFSLDEFGLYIYSFEFMSYDLASLAARVLIIFEFLLGVFILTFTYVKLINITTLVTILAFSGFLLWRIIVGDSNSCHCFGAYIDMNPTESLIKNAIILVLLFLGWKVSQRHIHKLILALIVFVIPIIVFAIWPPDFFYRIVRPSETELVEEKFYPQIQEDNLANGRKFICFYSPYCEHCKNACSKASLIISRNSVPLENVHAYIMGYEEQRVDVEDFFETYGHGLSLSYSFLDPYFFIDITSGHLPIFALIEDGKLVKEYDYLSLNEEEVISFFSN